MKRSGALIMLILHTTALYSSCEVCVEPLWQNIETSQKKQKFGSKLILVGSLTFRKRCKECVKLDKLVLSWHGKPIDSLCGALYRKLPEKPFYPIQEHLICDAQWNKHTQSLVLNFDTTQTLHAMNIFYIVLTVPDDIEPILKQGSFELKKNGVPSIIQFDQQQLDLALACAR